MASGGGTRSAAKAGSWYESNPRRLREQLESWLKIPTFINPAKALIVPHAGYSYSGETAAYSYAQIDPERVKNVFIFGPSHRVYFEECALPSVDKYETPLGTLNLDKSIISKLKQTEQFRSMNVRIDEEEHSIEMQLPYLAHIFREKLDQVTFIPVLVGNLKSEKESTYGQIFADYLKKEDSLFVISSDFCHWGSRFDYVRRDKEKEIHDSIETMDRVGISFIEKKDGKGFHNYLNETKNTICGRHPISLFLATLQFAEQKKYLCCEINLLHYDQSNRVTDLNESSVSYVAALCHLKA